MSSWIPALPLFLRVLLLCVFLLHCDCFLSVLSHVALLSPVGILSESLEKP